MSTEPLPVVVRRGAGRTSECGEALPIGPAPAGRAIGLDLSALDFADSFFLLRLRGFLDFHAAGGHTIDVVPPRDRSVAQYLAAWGSRSKMSRILEDTRERYRRWCEPRHPRSGS